MKPAVKKMGFYGVSSTLLRSDRNELKIAQKSFFLPFLHPVRGGKMELTFLEISRLESSGPFFTFVLIEEFLFIFLPSFFGNCYLDFLPHFHEMV